jgi:hypothetical protein
MKKFHAFLAAAALAACGAGSVSARQQVGPIVMGANPTGVFDWSRTHEFADLIKQSREFGPVSTPWDGGAPVDANGWPTGDFGVILFVAMEGITGYGGTYTIQFECATLPTVLAPGFNSGLGTFTRDANTGIVTGTVTLPPDPGSFTLQFIGTQGGVRNLKVMRPGHTPGDLFTNAFVQHMQRFKIVRPMDWGKTNDSPQVTWANRPTLQTAQWSRPTGVPWEVSITLANQLDQDLWVCLPHMANDDYVFQLATLLKNTLEPGRKVYVEYSNEMWNPLFQQFHWNFARAQTEAALPGSPLDFDNNGDGRIIAQRRVAKRTMEIGNIFEQVYGAPARNTVFRPIFGGRCWLFDEIREGLRMIEAAYGPPKNFFYGFATAPYIYIDFGNDIPNLTPQQVVQYLQIDADNMETNALMEQMGTLATWYGIEYLASEAGTDTTGPNSLNSKRLANLDPSLRPVVRQYISTWFAWGNGPMLWFTAGATNWLSPWGTTFGLTEDMNNQSTPKIQGIDDMIALTTLPAPRGGRLLPATIDARLNAFRNNNWAGLPYQPMGGTSTRQVDYFVRVDNTPKTFGIFPRASSFAGATFRISVDGQQIRNVVAPASGSDTTFVETAPAVVTLQPGHHVIRVDFVSGVDGNVQTLRVACPGDYNADGARNPSDIFFFLNLYFTGSARADFNGDGSRTPADIFAFLNAYFAGC